MATKPNINVYSNNPNRYNLSNRGGASNVKYIVNHYTAGTGSAKNNCIYFSNGNRNASADFFIDTDGTIWQFNPDIARYYTWQVGDGKGKYGITNANSLGIEYVNTGGPFTSAQIKSGAALIAWLRSVYNVPADRVVRHYDASRKSCPAYYVDNSRWNTLKSQLLTGEVTTTTPKPSTSTSTTSSALSVDGWFGPATIKKAQQQAGTTQDGTISNQPSSNKKYVPSSTSAWQWKSSNFALGSSLVKKIQQKVGASVDGFWGTGTSKSVQNYLIKKGYSCGNSGADGYFGNDSCKAFQRCINDGKFF